VGDGLLVAFASVVAMARIGLGPVRALMLEVRLADAALPRLKNG
jgi:hypothetical protein